MSDYNERDFDYKFIYGHISSDLVWVRVGFFHSGFSIKKTPKLFSERYGYIKSISLPKGWRIVFLKTIKKNQIPEDPVEVIAQAVRTIEKGIRCVPSNVPDKPTPPPLMPLKHEKK